MNRSQRGMILFVLLALVAIAFLGFCLYALSRAMTGIQNAQTQGIPPATVSDTPFVEAWSVGMNPPLVHQMAVSPGRRGEFLALNKDEIHSFDDRGSRLAKLKAPSKSRRLATDPTGAVPHVLVVSSSTKWTGAIDYVETTGYFLHALDASGREVWQKRFDPKDVTSPEPLILRIGGSPAIVLSTGQRILTFDTSGREIWNIPFWHHPGTVTAAPSTGQILAAQAPKKEIVVIDEDGSILGPWGEGDGPSRFTTMATRDGVFGMSLRQVFGRGAGVRHALAFFEAGGSVLREVELPPDSGLLSYSTIGTLDLDGRGTRRWVVGLGDGTLSVFSPSGVELARQATGMRLRTLLAVPQSSGADMLVTATHRGLTAWRPVPGRMTGPR